MSKIWFKRKYFGWGWYPYSWEGWLTIFVLAALNILIFRRVDLESNSSSDTLIKFFVQFILSIFILIFICYKKGEKPRWQWNGKPIKRNEK